MNKKDIPSPGTIPFARLPWRCDRRDQHGLVRVLDTDDCEVLVCEASIGAFIVECVNVQMPDYEQPRYSAK